MRIEVLGCSGGIGPDLRTTALLVDERFLIDAGTGVGDLSLARMQRIDTVYLTHAHLDHVCGLALMADGVLGGRSKPLAVRAAAQTLAALRQHLFNNVIWPDFTALPSPQAPLLALVAQQVYEREALGDGCFLTAFPVRHTVPAAGYLLETPDAAFAFSGDTYVNDAMWTFFNERPRLDKLMIEVAFADQDAELAEQARHLTPALLARELGKLGHRPEVLLTHAKPGAEAEIERQCAAALAGWRYRHLRRGELIQI